MKVIGVEQVESILKKHQLTYQTSHSKKISPITRVDSIKNSAEGSLSWAKGDKTNSPFNGSILIAGEDFTRDASTDFCLIKVKNPKFAFSLLVYELFSHLTNTRFAQRAEDFSKLDIRISPTAHVFPGAVIGEGTSIGDHVLVGPGTVMAHCEVGAHSRIGANCTIGLPGFGYTRDANGIPLRFPHIGRVKIGSQVEIGSNTCIDRGSLGDTVIEDLAKIDNLVHIAHNVLIKRGAFVIANAMVAGSAEVGENAWISPSASVRNQLKVGKNAVAGLGAVVVKDVPADETVIGNPAKTYQKKKE